MRDDDTQLMLDPNILKPSLIVILPYLRRLLCRRTSMSRAERTQ